MIRLLLVEDNEMNRDAIARLLARRGFEVITAETGEAGVEACLSHSPDLVLMDVGLPGIDGFEATRRIKSDPGNAAVKVIVLTARAMTSDLEAAQAAGCDDYDTKPVDMARLLGKIHAILGDQPTP